MKYIIKVIYETLEAVRFSSMKKMWGKFFFAKESDKTSSIVTYRKWKN